MSEHNLRYLQDQLPRVWDEVVDDWERIQGNLGLTVPQRRERRAAYVRELRQRIERSRAAEERNRRQERRAAAREREEENTDEDDERGATARRTDPRDEEEDLMGFEEASPDPPPRETGTRARHPSSPRGRDRTPTPPLPPRGRGGAAPKPTAGQTETVPASVRDYFNQLARGLPQPGWNEGGAPLFGAPPLPGLLGVAPGYAHGNPYAGPSQPHVPMPFPGRENIRFGPPPPRAFDPDAEEQRMRAYVDAASRQTGTELARQLYDAQRRLTQMQIDENRREQARQLRERQEVFIREQEAQWRLRLDRRRQEEEERRLEEEERRRDGEAWYTRMDRDRFHEVQAAARRRGPPPQGGIRLLGSGGPFVPPELRVERSRPRASTPQEPRPDENRGRSRARGDAEEEQEGREDRRRREDQNPVREMSPSGYSHMGPFPEDMDRNTLRRVMNLADAMATRYVPSVAQMWHQQRGSRPSFRKVPTFSNAKGPDWIVWKRQFAMICKIQEWSQQRAKQELFAAMSGEAARAVQDIEVENLYLTLEDVLNIYESRFVTASDSKMALVEFATARQTDDETVLQWHARLRELYTRANPGQPIDGATGTPYQLRERFILGLRDDSVRMYCLEQSPPTYAMALARAQEKQAYNLMDNQARTEQGSGKKKVNAIMEEPEEEASHALHAIIEHQKRCYICNKTGHFKDSCPDMKRKFDAPIGQITLEGFIRLYEKYRSNFKRDSNTKKDGRKPAFPANRGGGKSNRGTRNQNPANKKVIKFPIGKKGVGTIGALLNALKQYDQEPEEEEDGPGEEEEETQGQEDDGEGDEADGHEEN